MRHPQHWVCRRVAVFAAVFSFTIPAAAGTASFVQVAPASFNPSLGGKTAITVNAPADGRLSLQVLDRDGYAVRALAEERAVSAGRHVIEWDGRDAAGAVVADEAYSFKVTLLTPDGPLSYFPAAQPAKTFSVTANQYSRRNAALMYELPAPARVHVQAGSAALNAKTKQYDGPVLKTLVNREPRPAGSVVESWSGLDESGALYVPDVPNFVTAILATALPENAVIAFGNRDRSFLDVASSRKGTSLLPPAPAGQHAEHHAGLSALEDASPGLTLVPVGGVWDRAQKTWVFRGGAAEFAVELTGPTAAAVATQAGRIVVFVDYAMQFEVPVRQGREVIRIPRDRLAGGRHLVTVNWQSRRGPLAANSLHATSARPGTEVRHGAN